jgi:hypothetical protein
VLLRRCRSGSLLLSDVPGFKHSPGMSHVETIAKGWSKTASLAKSSHSRLSGDCSYQTGTAVERPNLAADLRAAVARARDVELGPAWIRASWPCACLTPAPNAAAGEASRPMAHGMHLAAAYVFSSYCSRAPAESGRVRSVLHHCAPGP